MSLEQITSKQFTMRNPQGLHMRPANQLYRDLVNLGVMEDEVLLRHRNEARDALDSLGIYTLLIEEGVVFTVEIHEEIEEDIRSKIWQALEKACQPIHEPHHAAWQQ